MQVQTFCWLPLRRGTIFISAACFVMAILNVVSAALPQDETQPKVTVVTRSVHAVLAVVYAAAGTLLAFALFLGSVALVRVWLALFSALTLASLLAHDLARYDWLALEQDSSAAVVAGIGLLNIVLDVVFLMAVFALLRQMERQKADDVEAARRPRPRASPGAPSLAPALPLKDLVPPTAATITATANTHHHQDDTTTRDEVGNIGRNVVSNVGHTGDALCFDDGGYVAPDTSVLNGKASRMRKKKQQQQQRQQSPLDDEDSDDAVAEAEAVAAESDGDGDCSSATESVGGNTANHKRLSRDSGWAAM